ncbi:MAG: hormogonium polysaccharide secretion pseudopilin HpsC [Coleofasciculaceae cyanobacterium]
MLRPFKFILKNQLKLESSRREKKIGGFTLIELLVGMILAALVITPLLGLMINVLKTDRDEQAKSNSEQELKSAVDYISQDLQQAVYIYDQDGLNPPPPGIQNQIPPQKDAPRCDDAATCTPVLVFWKRRLLPDAIPVVGGGNNDTFVYSLVAYYLVQTPDNTWSNVARIGRFEIRGGVTGANPPFDNADEGFAPLDLTGAGSLQNKMNRWESDAADFTQQAEVLIDYIDIPDPALNDPTNNDIPPGGITCKPDEQRIPADLDKNSFYACVNSAENYARLHIRGNAQARIQKDLTKRNYRSTFFPTATIQVEGKSSLPQ